MIPKTTFYSTKKDRLNEYKRNLKLSQLIDNKDELLVEKVQIKNKYKFRDMSMQEPILELSPKASNQR